MRLPLQRHTERSIAAVLPLLEMLSSQLRAAMVDADTTIDSTSQRFTAMGVKAREVIGFAERHSESDSPSSTQALVATAQCELNAMLKQLRDVTNASQRSVETMADLNDELTNVFQELIAIERVASKARIVALNGQMEAVRAGRQGAAFAEVANQTRDLATSVGEASTRIRQRIDRLGGRMAAVSQTMQQDAQHASQEYEERRTEVADVMERLQRETELAEESWLRAHRAACSLVEDISMTVVALQFQDAVGQRVRHVVDSLTEIGELLAREITPGDMLASAPLSQEILHSFERRYTMSGERRIHQNQTESDDSSGPGSVELF